MLFSITQRNQRNSGATTTATTNLKDSNFSAKSNHPRQESSGTALPGLSILTCCVSPQSDIGRVRIDRSMIGRPSDFRHIGHMGADDLSSSYNEKALNSMLSSKGDDEFGIPVPKNFRSKDIPISVAAN